LSYRLIFEIEDLPKMANITSGKSHWRYAHVEAKKWQVLVHAAIGSQRPPEPLLRATLHLTRFSSSQPDYDGLVRGFKSIVDGLVRSGVLVNDKLENTGAWNCSWERAPKNQGKVRVEVHG
jgi:hypothetical protein